MINKIILLLCTALFTTAAHANVTDDAPGAEIRLDLSLSSYQYQEPGWMLSQGGKFGVDLHITHRSTDDLFLRGEVRYALGTVDYTGSGQTFGEPDWYFEPRILLGRNWQNAETTVTGYSGLGYRYLFNDARGMTSTGAVGYRRESNYLYLPLGCILNSPLNERASLTSTLEYDLLIRGTQRSRLSDTGLGYSDVTNTQSKGYGLKASVSYTQGSWSFGPFLHYWNIDKSNWVPLYQNGLPVFFNGFPMGGVEPKNDTVEIGIRASHAY